MPAPTTCPYCNALVPIPAAMAPGRRVPCPRCGEAFPYRPPDEGDGQPSFSPAEAAVEPARSIEPPRRWSNRAVAGMVLTVMAGMAVMGLTFASLTTPIRRQQDAVMPAAADGISVPFVARAARLAYVGVLLAYLVGFLLRHGRETSLPARVGARLVVVLLGLLVLADLLAIAGYPLAFTPWRRVVEGPGGDPDAVRAVAPAELLGLRYLPADTGVVAGVHLAEAWQTPAGKDSLGRLRLGPTHLGLDGLERWTGLRPEDVDHAVLGVKVEALPPRVTLVVRTRRPYREDAVREALKAGRRTERGGKAIYRFPVEGLEGSVWFADAQTLVVGLTPADLDDVPREPRPDAMHLPEPVVGVLRDRLRRGTQAWLVGHAEDWRKTSAALLLLNQSNEIQGWAGKVRTAALWLEFEPGVTLNAAFAGKDEAAAQELDTYFGRLAADGSAFRLFGGERGEAVAKEFASTLTHSRTGTWVDVQARANVRDE